MDPATVTQQAPLRFAYVHQGHLYLASVSHFTVGWRYFADSRVTFEALEADPPTPQADFAVGMIKGTLEKVSIAAVR